MHACIYFSCSGASSKDEDGDDDGRGDEETGLGFFRTPSSSNTRRSSKSTNLKNVPQNVPQKKTSAGKSIISK